MPETPDLKALAERYLDLWEEQFSAAAADPALAAAMTAWLGPWRALAAGAAPAGGGEAVRKTHDANTGSKRSRDATAGTSAAAVASGDGGRGVDGLVERLERIERRLDALERQRSGKGGGVGAAARRGRTKGAG